MAKKNYGPTHREILNDIRNKKFAPVYILMGEESYYIDRIVEALMDNVVDESDRDFNCEIFFGADSDISMVAAAAQQYPVMAERKLVMLREAQTLYKAKAQLDKLAPYISNPNPSTVFAIIFKGESLNSTSALIKAANASSNTVVYNSPKLLWDYQLTGPLREYCTEIGVTIEDRAVAILCEYIGGPLSKLFKEVDRLKIAIGERTRIMTSDIEVNIGISKDFNNLELKTALAEKNYPKAMMITRYFRKNPKQNPPVVTCATIFDYFSKLCIAAFSADKSDTALKNALDLKGTGNHLKDYRSGLHNYNAAQVVKAVHAIRNFDTQSKGIGSLQNEYDLLDELIFNIMTG